MKILCRTVQPGPSVIPMDGLPCGVPGLAITRAMGTAGFAITHVRSGCAVLWFPDTDPEGILAAALELASLTDWTQSGTEVLAKPGLSRRVRAVGDNYDAQPYSVGRPPDGEDIH
jgi:hypothetical protein